jgi:hypothetical protein
MIDFSQSRLCKRLASVRHGVLLFIGTGQHGKTVTMHAILNTAPFKGRNIALINYPPDFVNENYPSHYRAVRWPDNLEDIPKVIHPSRDIVAIDDAAWLVAARDHSTMANKNIQKLLTIASHHELFFALTIQNSSMMDFSIVQSQDTYIIHKQMDAMSLEFERPEVKTRQVIANAALDNIRRANPSKHPKGWSYCSTTWEMLYNQLPSWWQPKLSKPFYGVIPK